MNFNKSFTYKESRICLIKNDFSVEELNRKFEHPEFYKKRMEQIGSEYRRKEFLAIRYALKQCFDGEEKEINYATDGKPSLKSSNEKISFSHCRDWVAVITHPSSEVGIDVEIPSGRLKKVHRRFLHTQELEFYNTTHSLEYLRIIWSAKEALYKIIGEKAYNFSEQLLIEPFDIKDKGQINAKHVLTDRNYQIHYRLNRFFTLAFSIENE